MSLATTLDPNRSAVIPGRRATAPSRRPNVDAPDQAAVPTREDRDGHLVEALRRCEPAAAERVVATILPRRDSRSEEHTSELQSLAYFVCRLLLEKKKRRARRDTWGRGRSRGQILSAERAA